MVFAGIDLHKMFLQMAVVGSDWELLRNQRIEDDTDSTWAESSNRPKDAKYVPEPSL